ncbi:MAG: sodium:solute symporter [Flavobacteriales bacterium]|nr:sodium:solute symporter [Flavobacteriales bacterium]
MSPILIVLLIVGYFAALIVIARITGRKNSNADFFLGGRKSPWYVVAFGMVGASLSGVTFISVPGWTGTSQFSYMQMVLGYLPGYLVVAFVLLPLYYRMQLTSIYTYLESRFGPRAIIWTDTLQTAFMLLAVGMSVYSISDSLGFSTAEMITAVKESEYSQIFFFGDANDPRFFFKQFFAGMFITITMTGLDQDMMQKNLSCRNLRDAQKNMVSFAVVLLFVNLVFLSLGALLYLFAEAEGIALPAKTDELYPMLATDGLLGAGVGTLFVLGLIAAAYSSADSALTSLTTSFSIDILGVDKRDPEYAKRTRMRVHIGMSLVLVAVIMLFKAINNDAVIDGIFKAAGYTYGPLLGLYAYGLFSKRKARDSWIPYIAVLSPVLSYGFVLAAPVLFGGYKVGYEVLMINGAFTYLGLVLAPSGKKGEGPMAVLQ